MNNRDTAKYVCLLFTFAGILTFGLCQNAQHQNSLNSRVLSTDVQRHSDQLRNEQAEKQRTLDENATVFTNRQDAAESEVAPRADGNENSGLLLLGDSESSFFQQQRFNTTSTFRQKGGNSRNHKKRRRKNKVAKSFEEENVIKEGNITQLKERGGSWYSNGEAKGSLRVRQSRKKFRDERRRRRKNRDRKRDRSGRRKNSLPLCFQKVGKSWTIFTRSGTGNITHCKNATDSKTIRQINLLASVSKNDTEGAEPIVYGTASKSGDKVEKDFSRSLEEEVAKSRLESEVSRENQATRRNEYETERIVGIWKSAPIEDHSRFDAERMLGYERTDEDLPILDLENDVLKRTLKDYNAYMSSSHFLGKTDRDYHESKSKAKETRIPDVPMALRLRGQLSIPEETESPEDVTLDADDTRGDLSCINGTFLPAPLTRHALIKYVKSSIPGQEYLEADYECAPGYYITTNTSRLLCKNRRWIGEVPKCKVRQNPSELCAEMSCEQVCKEIDGRAVCSCFEGFLPDGRNCIDINECEKSNGDCEYKCVNMPGSYRCECPKGMKQGEDKYTCVDINECLLNNGHGPCQDTCRNLIGGYECSCDGITNTVLSPDNHTCQDASPCNYNNAGCSHTCLSTMGRVFCLCPDGFMLEDDWKTCQDVDECAVTDLQTELCRYGCINTPGSYRCIDPAELSDQLISNSMSMACPAGFEASKSGSCIDTNECAADNGGCSEVCENTNGSYFCACEGDERILSLDGKSCIDINSVSCPSLNPTGRGVLVCSQSSATDIWTQNGTNRPGAKCFLKCPPRYQLRGEYELTCQSDGTWDGPKHGECVKYSKPRLDCPKDVVAEVPPGRDEAFVTFDQPSTDLDWFRYVRSKPSWGTRLEANLKMGVHEITFYARHPVSKKQTTCVLRITIKDGEAPKVKDCPSNIEVIGGNGSAVTWTEPTFTDNVKVMRVTKSAEPGHLFDVGAHKVEYEANDEAGWTAKCIFTVIVRQQ